MKVKLLMQANKGFWRFLARIYTLYPKSYYTIVIFSCIIFRSTASWPIECPTEETQGWRYIRLQQTGKNASGQTHYLSLSGFEIYGKVTGVCDDIGKYIYIWRSN